MSYVARLPGPAVRMHGLNGSYEKFAGDPQEQALSSGQRPVNRPGGSSHRTIGGAFRQTSPACMWTAASRANPVPTSCSMPRFATHFTPAARHR